MQTYNEDSYGWNLYVNFGEDISANTALTMTIRPQRGDDISVTPTLGTSDVSFADTSYDANEYVYYPTTSDMFTETGRYKVMATALVGTEMKTSKWQEFRITKGA